MKALYTSFFILFFALHGIASDFITIWDLNLQPELTIRFKATCSVLTNYRWESIPSGYSGTGKIVDTFTDINFPFKGKYRLSIPSEGLKYFTALYQYQPVSALVDVEQWGNAQWTSFNGSFYGCQNLNISANDIPNLSKVVDLSFMFFKCSQLNGPSNIGYWNTSNVTNMAYMFCWATNFNQSIGNWNTSNVNQMDYMFSSAISFNQPIGNWNTLKLGVMDGMFNNAKAFNQNIGNWHFYPYEFTYLNFLAHFFDNSGMDCANYSKTLIEWSEHSYLPKNVTFGAIDMKYTIQAKKARDYLKNVKGWKFVGDIISTGYCFLNSIPNGNTDVYPNPCNDKLFVNYFNYATNLESWVNFKIFDMNGNTIKTGVLESLGSNVFEIDTRELSSGIYILYMLDENIINISRTLFSKN